MLTLGLGVVPAFRIQGWIQGSMYTPASGCFLPQQWLPVGAVYSHYHHKQERQHTIFVHKLLFLCKSEGPNLRGLSGEATTLPAGSARKQRLSPFLLSAKPEHWAVPRTPGEVLPARLAGELVLQGPSDDRKCECRAPFFTADFNTA